MGDWTEESMNWCVVWGHSFGCFAVQMHELSPQTIYRVSNRSALNRKTSIASSLMNCISHPIHCLILLIVEGNICIRSVGVKWRWFSAITTRIAVNDHETPFQKYSTGDYIHSKSTVKTSVWFNAFVCSRIKTDRTANATNAPHFVHQHHKMPAVHLCPNARPINLSTFLQTPTFFSPSSVDFMKFMLIFCFLMRKVTLQLKLDFGKCSQKNRHHIDIVSMLPNKMYLILLVANHNFWVIRPSFCTLLLIESNCALKKHWIIYDSIWLAKMFGFSDENLQLPKKSIKLMWTIWMVDFCEQPETC